MKHYIIDGNNLIGKVKRLSDLQNKDKQSAREQLVFLLQKIFAGKKIKISLHFDGYENTKLNLGKGKIIYSESKSADDKIKEQVSNSKNRREIVVVSSDNGIRNFAKVCGCSLMMSEEFYSEFMQKSQADEEESIINQMKKDVDEFKKLFDVDD